MLDCDSAEWSTPPTGPEAQGGLPTVDVRFNVWRIANVDTVNCTAYIKFNCMLYWTDSRIAGWGQPNLPPLLWGPSPNITQSTKELDQTQSQFVLADRATGRLKRGWLFEGIMENTMETLSSFPFDVDDLEITFKFNGWCTYNQERKGFPIKGKQYNIRPMPKENREGKLLIRAGWSGKVNEFNLVGFSHDGPHESHRSNGTITQEYRIRAHLYREWDYYLWRVLLPLFMLTFLSFMNFDADVDDVATRSSNIYTMFLAAFAFLYVVGESLPKTQFLTSIDKVVFASLTLFTVSGLCSRIVLWVSWSDEESAQRLNIWMECVLFVAFFGYNAHLLGPLAMQQKKAVQEWETKENFVRTGAMDTA
jgi:hypothetical protein